MNISKTTFNMARKRGLELTVECNEDYTLLCVWEESNDMEWLFAYRLEPDLLSWHGCCCLPAPIKEELPGTIRSEEDLRGVIKYVHYALHLPDPSGLAA